MQQLSRIFQVTLAAIAYLFALMAMVGVLWAIWLLAFDRRRYSQINTPFDPVIDSVLFGLFWFFIAGGIVKRITRNTERN